MSQVCPRPRGSHAAAGHGGEDDSAVIKLYATLGGIELPPAAGSRAPGI